MVLRSVTKSGFITNEQKKKNNISVQLSVKINHFSDMPSSSICCRVAVSSAMERECYTVPWLFFSVITIPFLLN